MPSEHFIGATANRLNEIFYTFMRTIPINEIDEALALGEPLLISENARYAENLAKPLTEALNRNRTFVFDKAGKEGIKAVPSQLSFNILNPRAVEFIEKFGYTIIKGITDETAEGIRAAMLSAFKEGEGGYVAARRIRGGIGLTERQSLALQRYRRGLSQLIDKRMNRYSKKLHKYRADRIARTELNRAANQGEIESWRQLADKGYIDRDRSEKCWMWPAMSKCVACEELDGTCVSINESFSGADTPPLHPNCMCTIYLKPVKPR